MFSQIQSNLFKMCRNSMASASKKACKCNGWRSVQYLLDQFLSDGVDFGLDAFLCLGRVLRVEWPVESQQVLQRALVRRDVRVL